MSSSTDKYKVLAPWVKSGHKKGDIITAAQAEKSGDSVAHLIHAGNIEAVEAPKKAAPKPKAAPKTTAPKGQSKRSQQRAAAKARAAAAASTAQPETATTATEGE
jgi:hypothetical protein